MSQKFSAEQLNRRAVVYVRQSTPTQVIEHAESHRRQYELVQKARQMGFQQVDVIDEDLGRSGSGVVERPGFQRLVTLVLNGVLGAIFALEVSRLARNGRDWHLLIDLCSLVGTLLVDADGVYDARLTNDRLLLGMKGSMSEFELNLLQQRARGAIQQKAQRGEYVFGLPAGLRWTEAGTIEIDPDRRIRESIQLVFDKFEETGSARQVLRWFKENQVSLPVVTPNGSQLRWKCPPKYYNIIATLRNPSYAGAYAYGRRGTRIDVVEGRARKRTGRAKPRDQWHVLIKDHHPGYISWEVFEKNQVRLDENAFSKKGASRKSGRGGHALLSGMIRCGRCARILHVSYHGPHGKVIRYTCREASSKFGNEYCVGFGGVRVDAAIAKELLRVLDVYAIDAALLAAERGAEQGAEQLRALKLELEQARYEAELAARRYETVDPQNRLVASELELRWNQALDRAHRIEGRISAQSTAPRPAPPPDRATLLALSADLESVWHATTDPRLKQRIVRTLIQEIIADVDPQRDEIHLVIHWKGGRHSELRVKRNKSGHHGRSTDIEAIEIIRKMAGRFSDQRIAVTLNMLGLKTGAGNSWDEVRVCAHRSRLGLPKLDRREPADVVTIGQAKQELGLSYRATLQLIEAGILQATQVVRFAPWEISLSSLRSDEVRQAAQQLKLRGRRPHASPSKKQTSIFPET